MNALPRAAARDAADRGPADATDGAVPPLVVEESRDFRSYHAFLRAARNFMEGPLVGRMRDAYDRALEEAGAPPPADWRAAEAVLDGLAEYQFYCWSYRHLQLSLIHI